MDTKTIIGAVLWWAEGSKSRRDKRWKNAVSYPLEMTNTDPLAIQMFLRFIREDLKIDESKLKLQLQVHENDNVDYLEKYWSEVTKIPKSRFHKTIIRPQGNKVGKSKGTCKVRLHNKEIYLKAKAILENILSGSGAVR